MPKVLLLCISFFNCRLKGYPKYLSRFQRVFFEKKDGGPARGRQDRCLTPCRSFLQYIPGYPVTIFCALLLNSCHKKQEFF